MPLSLWEFVIPVKRNIISNDNCLIYIKHIYLAYLYKFLCMFSHNFEYWGIFNHCSLSGQGSGPEQQGGYCSNLSNKGGGMDPRCYSLNICVHPKIRVGILIPHVMVLKVGTSGGP